MEANMATVCNDVSNAENEVEVVSSWLLDQTEEVHMEDDHVPMWSKLISKMNEPSLEGARVLDFGCNRGGFLQTLYRIKPFEYGLGIDIAQAPIDFARGRSGSAPVEYKVCNNPQFLNQKFDVAFSYEVIYLLPDIEQHAHQMYSLLDNGGVYYFATGCHTDYPGWQRCKNELLNCSTVTPRDYSLTDYRETFSAAGFEVSACRLQLDTFVRVDLYPEYFPRVEDSLDYFEKYVVIFRCQKPGRTSSN
jgi:SAM-dependent methyltransferase